MSAAHSPPVNLFVRHRTPPVNLFVRHRTLAVRFRRGRHNWPGRQHEGEGGERRPGAGSGRIRVTGATQDQGNGREPSSAATSSAICAVFSAAPLRRLSPQTNNSIVRGSSRDWRTRPTQDGSVPTTSTGVGNSLVAGSSATTTPGAARSTRHASSLPTGRENTACTATEWVVTTGTRTQVADTRSDGRPRILRDSLRILSSSDDQPSGLTEPAHGTTFIASGAGNGPRSPTAARTSPARWPSDRVPATLSSCA